MGCAWFIPLHNGSVSIGVVQDQGDTANTKCALCKCKGDCTLVDYYLDELKATPGMLKYIVNGKLVPLEHCAPEFDELFLRHAATSGIAIFEDTKVTSLDFCEQ